MAARIVKHAFEIMHLLTGEVGHLAVLFTDMLLLIFFGNSAVHKAKEFSSDVPPFTTHYSIHT